MKLVNNWSSAWRWYSVRSMGLAAALQGAWLMLPPDMAATVPQWLVQAMTAVLLVSGIVGRLVDQGDD